MASPATKRIAPARAAPGSIAAQAPCRMDFAGATLDLWPLYLFHPGAVTVNAAVSVMTSCRITPQAGRRITLRSADTGQQHNYRDLAELQRTERHGHGLGAYLVREFAPQGGFTLETHSESPAGAGISGSSALMIATAAALAHFTGRRMGKEALRQLAQNVEAQLIRVPTGCQDYYPALYGGVSIIHLEEAGIRRQAMAISPREIEERFVLAYTGAPRQSGINNWEVFKAHINGDRRVFRNFAEIARIAREMAAALASRNWDDVGRLLRAEWKLRRTNAPGITTPLIDRLVEQTSRAGARGAKVCGAGGGGCAIFFVEPGARERVKKVIAQCGAQVLPYHVAARGLQVRKVPAGGMLAL